MFKTGFKKRCYYSQSTDENDVIFGLAKQFMVNKGVDQTGLEIYFFINKMLNKYHQ